MKYLNDRTWPYQGTSSYDMKVRASVLNKFWRDHIRQIRLRRVHSTTCAAALCHTVPKATFSYVIAVMDKVEGWKEEQWVGTYLAASMWIYTKSVLYDGRKRDPPLVLQPILSIIVESVSWVTEDFLWDHEWITETKVTMKENVILEALHCDIEVPCPLQCASLWFSAPTNLNSKFVNNGTTVAKFRDTVSSAIELTCNIAVDGAHTPRECFLRAVTIQLSYAPDKDCDLKEEMQGWA